MELVGLVHECPWLTYYWWDNTPIPIGHPRHKHPVTREVILFKEVHAHEILKNVKLLPLGDFEGQNRILGPHRGALAEEFYPFTVDDGDLEKTDLIMRAGLAAGGMIPNPAAEILPANLTNKFIQRMLECHMKAYCWDYSKVHDSIYVAKTRTIESYYSLLNETKYYQQEPGRKGSS
jgi:hypothetical protein